MIAASLLTLVPAGARAQFGPLQARGYLEYQYQNRQMEGGASQDAHAAAVRTDFSTFYWRPWLAQVSGTIVVAERKTLLDAGRDESSVIQGGMRLHLLPRSRFPLTMFYEQFDNYATNGPNISDGTRQSYGFLQQLSARRMGTYSLEYRNTEYDSLYANGHFVPNKSANEVWQFTGQKSFENNAFVLSSSSLQTDSRIPDSYRDIVRHSLRHNFRAGRQLTVQNSFFYNDELSSKGTSESLRHFSQLSSTATWRPATAKRLLVSGRGLFQNSGANGDAPLREQDRAFLSLAANYQLTDHVALFGSAGFANTDDDLVGQSDSSFQQVGATYASDMMPLLGGTYGYNGQFLFGSRNDATPYMEDDLQNMNGSIGHSFSKSVAAFGGRPLNFRVTQQAMSHHDSDGSESNSLRHAVQLSTSGRLGELSQYFRIGLIDQRDFADESRIYRLADAAYSLQGNIDRYRSWNLDFNAQFGFREQDKPVELAEKTKTASYSASVMYRHADLFQVPFLDFTSDLRLQSEDYRSDDPFDMMSGMQTDRVASSWRNQLDYRVGLLQLRASVDLYDSNGMWNTLFNLTARRYFGFN